MGLYVEKRQMGPHYDEGPQTISAQLVPYTHSSKANCPTEPGLLHPTNPPSFHAPHSHSNVLETAKVWKKAQERGSKDEALTLHSFFLVLQIPCIIPFLVNGLSFRKLFLGICRIIIHYPGIFQEILSFLRWLVESTYR